MKILFAYSKTHFDPDKPKKDHKFLGSSAHTLSSNLYKILGELGDVTYVDCWRQDEISAVENQTFDVFIGIIDAFAELADKVTAGQKILFAVNSHPVFRNQQLTDFVEHERMDKSALNDWDLVSPAFESAVEKADYIIGVGDNVVYNTFIEQGVPKQKIKMVNYGAGPALKQSSAKSNRFVYVASDVGLRKGFDILCSAFSHPAMQSKDFHLDIVGPIQTPYHQKKMDVLKSTLKNKLTYHGWLDVESKAFSSVMSGASFLVYPTLEEGQAGTVLDALRYGLIPITSNYSGVPFSPLGHFELSSTADTNTWLLLEALGTDDKALKSMRAHAKQYYEEFHANFFANLKSTVQQVVAGNGLYPKISLVLPIFNKEGIIESLLDNLDQSCLAYGNNELHIIFDGCHDNTEKIVKGFYKNKHDYPVTYETTDDIFEVKTNNIGLKKSTGKYAAIIQDDNFIYDRNAFFETAMLLDNNPQIAILGGLAGVNFYPRGTKNLKGSGQIAINDNEVYWRQDANTNKEFKKRYYEVDACMRGPLFFRKSFLEEHGYLDEAYAPFYMDDMDICFRAKKHGYHVYTALFNVENRSATVATYSTEERKKFWEDTMKRTADIFYSRWTPSTQKDYNWTHRTTLVDSEEDLAREAAFNQLVADRQALRQRKLDRRRKLLAPARKTKRGVYGVARRIKNKVSS